MVLRLCLTVLCLQLVCRQVIGQNSCDLTDEIRGKSFWHYDDEDGTTEQLITFTNSRVSITSVAGSTLSGYDCLISSVSLPTETLLIQRTGGSEQLCIEILRHRNVMAIRKISESGQSTINPCTAQFTTSTNPFFIYIEYDGGLVYNQAGCSEAMYAGEYGLEYTLTEGGPYQCVNVADSMGDVNHDTDTLTFTSCDARNSYFSPFTMDFKCLASYTPRAFGSGSTDHVVILMVEIGNNDRFYCARFNTFADGDEITTYISVAALDDTRTVCEYSATADWAKTDTAYDVNGRYIQYVLKTNACERLSQPCQNGVTCTNLRTSPGYSCQCFAGYTGYQCETDINECASRPCENGGVCTDEINAYTCQCDTRHFSGTNCEIVLCPFAEEFVGTWLVGYDSGYDDPITYSVHDDVYDILDSGETRTCMDDRTAGEITYVAWKNNYNKYGCTAFRIVEGLLFFKHTNPSNIEPTATSCRTQLQPSLIDWNIGFDYSNDRIEAPAATIPFTSGDYHVTINENGNLDQCSTHVASTAMVLTESFEIESCMETNTYRQPFNTEFDVMAVIDPYDIDDAGDDIMVLGRQDAGSNNYAFYPIRYREENIHVYFSLDKEDEYSWTLEEGVQATRISQDYTFIKLTSNRCDDLRPCENLGNCVDLMQDYTCFCLSGFTGDHCETNINECLSRPCQNGGVCTDEINGYTCQCDTTQFSGTHCEIVLCPFAEEFVGTWLVGYDSGYDDPITYNVHDDVYDILDSGETRTCKDKETTGEITYVVWKNSNNKYGCTAFRIVEGLLFFKHTNPSNVEPTANSCRTQLQRSFIDWNIGYDYSGDRIEAPAAAIPFTSGDYHVTINENGNTGQCSTDVTSTALVFTERLVVESCMETNTYFQPFNTEFAVMAVINPDDIDDAGDDIMVLGRQVPGSNNYAFYPIRYKEDNIYVYLSLDKEDEYSWTLEEGVRSTLISQDYTYIRLTSNRCDDLRPCQNSGTCADLMQDYRCFCLSGFTGDHCETDINDCSSNLTPCGEHGDCVDETGGFRCDCDPNWSGDYCTDFDYCSSTPCENGGICANTAADTFRCSCLSGYTGIRCEIEIDECASDPCQNGGNCNDMVASYSCVCQEGTMGPYCQTNINECDSNPCENLSTCEDRINGYYCFCDNRFSGVHCEHDNECFSNPCQNGAACTDDLYFYRCECTLGWAGTNCEDVGDCPCENGGNCTTGSFTCACPAGFEGTYCQERPTVFQCNLLCRILISLFVAFVIGCILLISCLCCCKRRWRE